MNILKQVYEIMGSSKEPMDKETTGILVKLLVKDDSFESDMTNPMHEDLVTLRSENGTEEDLSPMRMAYAILTKRCTEPYGLKLSLSLVAFIGFLTRLRPGSLVLYGAYLAYHMYLTENSSMNLTQLCRVFPVGFPDEDTLSKAWESQKRRTEVYSTDNWLDDPDTWKQLISDEVTAR